MTPYISFQYSALRNLPWHFVDFSPKVIVVSETTADMSILTTPVTLKAIIEITEVSPYFVYEFLRR